MRRVIPLALLALGLPAMLMAADWPRFRGPSANGISPEKGINKNWKAKAPKLLWKAQLTDQGTGGPAIAGGRVYILDHQGANDIVRCLDARTGRDIWKTPYRSQSKNDYGYTHTTPTVTGGKVFTLSRVGLVNCLDARSGKILWSKNIGASLPGWDLAMSVRVDGNKAIVVPGAPGATVMALSTVNGKPLWKCSAGDKPGYATPVLATIGGTQQYVVFCATKVIGVNAANGKLLWSFPWKTEYDVNAADPIPLGNSVFITSGYNHGCALLDVAGGKAKARYQNRALHSQFTSPVYVNGALFCTNEGSLVCLDPKSGKVLWQQRGFEKGGVAYVDGALVVVDGANGDVALVSASTRGYQELGRIRSPLGGGSVWTPPAIANGCLFVRNKGALACFSLK